MGPSSPDVFVVRFGEMKDVDLLQNAEVHYAKYETDYGVGEYAISVNIVPDMTSDEIAAFAERPWRQYRATTVAALRAAGFDLAPFCEADGHTNLLLPPRPPTTDDWVQLRGIFDLAGINPKPVKPEDRRIF